MDERVIIKNEGLQWQAIKPYKCEVNISRPLWFRIEGDNIYNGAVYIKDPLLTGFLIKLPLSLFLVDIKRAEDVAEDKEHALMPIKINSKKYLLLVSRVRKFVEEILQEKTTQSV